MSFAERLGVLVVLGTYFILLGSILIEGFGLCDGRLVYALDDPYIHMAMARSLADHGVWGITPDGFTGSSSSPGWVLLLAPLLRFLPAPEWIPLLLNNLAGVMLVLVLDRALARQGTPGWLRIPCGLAVVATMPLATMTVLGMEHVPHALLALAFADRAAEALAAPAEATPPATLFGLAALLCMARYEGLFAVAGAVAVALVLGRFLFAFALAAAGWAPVVAYGVLAHQAGGWFLPNSLLVKVETQAAVEAAQGGPWLLQPGSLGLRLKQCPELGPLVIAAVLLALFARGEGLMHRARIGLAIFAGTALLHLHLAHVGWFFRYEAYLVPMGLAALAGFAAAWWIEAMGDTSRKAALLVGLLLALPFLKPLAARGAVGFGSAPHAMATIYHQHIQVGLFLETYYAGQPVACNDIGAMAWLGRAKPVDLWGLADLPVAEARVAGRYDRAFVASYAASKGARVFFGYEDWYRGLGGLPEGWVKVGEWRHKGPVTFSGNRISWYATVPEEVEPLKRNLALFAPRLPGRIEQSGSYLPVP